MVVESVFKTALCNKQWNTGNDRIDTPNWCLRKKKMVHEKFQRRSSLSDVTNWKIWQICSWALGFVSIYCEHLTNAYYNCPREEHGEYFKIVLLCCSERSRWPSQITRRLNEFNAAPYNASNMQSYGSLTMGICGGVEACSLHIVCSNMTKWTIYLMWGEVACKTFLIQSVRCKFKLSGQ